MKVSQKFRMGCATGRYFSRKQTRVSIKISNILSPFLSLFCVPFLPGGGGGFWWLNQSADGSLSDTAAAGAGEAKKGIMKNTGGITGMIGAANEAGSEGQGMTAGGMSASGSLGAGAGGLGMTSAGSAGRLSILQQPGGLGGGPGAGGLGGPPGAPGSGGGPGGMGKKSSSTSQLSAAGKKVIKLTNSNIQ